MSKVSLRRYPNLVLFVAAVIVLAGIEAVLQAALPDLRDPTYFQSVGKPLTQYKEDPDLFWVHGHDFYGFEVIIGKSKATHLIYLLGGSIANGLAKPMQKTLESEHLFVETVNLTCGGYTSYQSLILLDRFLTVRAPEAAVICNGFNDSRPAFLDYRAQAELNRRLSRRALFVLNKSRLFTLYRRLMVRAVHEKSIREREPTTRCVPLDHYRENLTRFVSACREHGVTPVLVTQAFPEILHEQTTAPYFDAMARVAASSPEAVLVDVRPAVAEAMKRMGVPYISSDPEGFTKTGSLLWSDCCCHPSWEGYAIMAREIRKEMQQRGIW